MIRQETIASTPTSEKRRLDFVYDSQSRRVSKKSYTWNGTAWALQDSRRFLYDQFNLIAELDDSGAVINSYAWGIDLSGSMYGAGGVGGLLVVNNNNQNYFPSFDGNGNVLGYVNQTGSVTCQMEYGPFGELLRATGSLPSAFGFSTKYRDSETGLKYYGYRYYSAGLGRWLGRDPIGEEGEMNLYGFCNNSPTIQFDAFGMRSATSGERAFWLALLGSPHMLKKGTGHSGVEAGFDSEGLSSGGGVAGASAFSALASSFVF